VRKLPALVLIPLMCIAGCGGGGGGSSGGGGGGGGSGGGGTATAGPPNVESIVLDAGPAQLTVPAVNTAFVSVKVCVHGTATCQTIDHVEVDTGSVGLRLIAGGNAGGELTIALTPLMDSANQPLAECLEFADGFSWGSVATADVTMPVSGETASNVIVQIIGATSVGNPASANPTCVPFSNTPLVTENTVTSFGANGIIGVGPFLADCVPGASCPPGTPQCQTISGVNECVPEFSSTYYSCPTPTTCAQTTASASQQLQNPGSMFANDNNGVILELPALTSSGAANPPGAVLVFGIGTESNNGLGSAAQIMADNETGFISAMLNGASFPDSYLDSGSNGNFFSSSLTLCGTGNQPNAGFYCPSATTSENATLGSNAVAADFDVANANTLF
jgi:Protein of unknown function (DUF3443)